VSTIVEEFLRQLGNFVGTLEKMAEPLKFVQNYQVRLKLSDAAPRKKTPKVPNQKVPKTTVFARDRDSVTFEAPHQL
jgi:hypothetical protein